MSLKPNWRGASTLPYNACSPFKLLPLTGGRHFSCPSVFFIDSASLQASPILLLFGYYNASLYLC